MIKEVIIKNFKSISEQTYKFSDFDLLVGRNNSGKSTILQAMAIWQYCVDEFHRMKRTGKSGAQIVLPNFTALPLPEFNLLWTNKIDRKYQNGSKSADYILIEINLKYLNKDGSPGEFGVFLRYQTPQSIYAIPVKGWAEFKKLDKAGDLPRIVYVPPFSGLDPYERWADDGIVRQNVGKGQPGSVLRNLLCRVIDRYELDKDKLFIFFDFARCRKSTVMYRILKIGEGQFRKEFDDVIAEAKEDFNYRSKTNFDSGALLGQQVSDIQATQLAGRHSGSG